ncbi:hypothetical protein Gohar_004229, partial [Gossypium harknessii]|nr:hypothetical protein [Gossypium harknessii]
MVQTLLKFLFLKNLLRFKLECSNGCVALTSTFEVTSKGKTVVMDLSPTLKLNHVYLMRSSNRFKALSVE